MRLKIDVASDAGLSPREEHMVKAIVLLCEKLNRQENDLKRLVDHINEMHGDGFGGDFSLHNVSQLHEVKSAVKELLPDVDVSVEYDPTQPKGINAI